MSQWTHKIYNPDDKPPKKQKVMRVQSHPNPIKESPKPVSESKILAALFAFGFLLSIPLWIAAAILNWASHDNYTPKGGGGHTGRGWGNGQ